MAYEKQGRVRAHAREPSNGKANHPIESRVKQEFHGQSADDSIRKTTSRRKCKKWRPYPKLLITNDLPPPES